MTRAVTDFKHEILEQFRGVKAEAGHTLSGRRLHLTYLPSLNPKEKENFVAAASELCAEDFLEECDGMGFSTYKITEKGVNAIYDGRTKDVAAIKEDLTSLFREVKADVGHVIGHKRLMNYMSTLHSREVALVDVAFDELIAEGIIEEATTPFSTRTGRLTAKGVDAIY